MSSLWTPSGEHEPTPEPVDDGATGPRADDQEPALSAEELEALRHVRAQIRATPASAIVANHAVQLFELALVYLGIGAPPSPDGVEPGPDLAQAGVAIDAMAALVDGLGVRLDEHEGTLREALAQIQVLYAQIADATD
ncbi:MAG TPA: hypothetical protein VFZ83_14925 [Acidimicrobiia bacterium]|nr:hypothetical protein [Acidimicrobiia bacterium]